MPIFQSSSPAGYDVDDFSVVDPDYGTVEDFEALTAAAHDRGLRVLLGLPFNHTSLENAWFTEASADPSSARRDWYVLADEQHDTIRWFPDGNGSYYYAYFGEGFPDLNWRNPELVEAMLSVLEIWADRGADGFRLDAVLQLIESDVAISDTPQTHCLLRWLYAEHARRSDASWLAEAWHKELGQLVEYLGPEDQPETDQALNVPRRSALLIAFDGDSLRLTTLLNEEASLGVSDRLASYLGSHDTDRLSTVVPNAATRRALMLTHLLLPGTPVLYYGDEIGLPDALETYDQDRANRGLMHWDDGHAGGFTSGEPWFPYHPDVVAAHNVAAAEAEPSSTLNVVRAVNALRATHPTVREGRLRWLKTSDAARVLAFERTLGNERLWAVINLSGDALESVGVVVEGAFISLTEEGERVSSDGLLQVEDLVPYGYRVYGTQAFAGVHLPAAD
jgi:glycosidase